MTAGPEGTPVLFSIGLYDNNVYYKQIAAITNPVCNKPVLFSIDSRNNGYFAFKLDLRSIADRKSVYNHREHFLKHGHGIEMTTKDVSKIARDMSIILTSTMTWTSEALTNPPQKGQMKS